MGQTDQCHLCALKQAGWSFRKHLQQRRAALLPLAKAGGPRAVLFMDILNTSLFGSRERVILGVGYHNVGTGVLRASNRATIDYVEEHYGQRCGHLPLDALKVCVLVNAQSDENDSHLHYLSQLYGQDIEAITPVEMHQYQQHLSTSQMMVVPYINVHETEQ